MWSNQVKKELCFLVVIVLCLGAASEYEFRLTHPQTIEGSK